MSDITPIRPRIVIHKTTGGALQLHECYFLATDVEGVYNLYNEHSRILAANLCTGQDFNFTVEGVHFHIHDFEIDEIAATGDWRHNPLDNDPEGTFQAGSGGGFPVDDEAVPASAMPSNGIEVKSVTGGSTGDKLKKCYFVPTGSSKYSFYDKDDTLLASGLKDDNNFNFSHDSITWKVTKFSITDKAASGNWSNSKSTEKEEGTFQAASGGGLGEDGSASAASA